MVDLTCKDILFNFGDKEKASFEALKAAFTTAPVLQYPDQDCEFRLETDTSEFAVGGVISIKCDDGEFRPVAYMSHSMTPPEQNYPIHDKEILAIIKATEAWRHYLEATPSTVKSANSLRCLTRRLLDHLFLSLPLPLPGRTSQWTLPRCRSPSAIIIS